MGLGMKVLKPTVQLLTGFKSWSKTRKNDDGTFSMQGRNGTTLRAWAEALVEWAEKSPANGDKFLIWLWDNMSSDFLHEHGFEKKPCSDEEQPCLPKDKRRDILKEQQQIAGLPIVWEFNSFCQDRRFKCKAKQKGEKKKGEKTYSDLCEKNEKKLNALHMLICKFFSLSCDGDYVDVLAETHYNLYAKDLIDWLAKNANELRELGAQWCEEVEDKHTTWPLFVKELHRIDPEWTNFFFSKMEELYLSDSDVMTDLILGRHKEGF